MLLDEPLGALDLKLREEMQEELKQLQRALGITFVFVTHDQSEALSMADRIAVFNEGEIAQIGTPQDIYHRPETEFVANFVGSSNVLPAALVRQMSGRTGIASLRPESIRVVAEGGHTAIVTAKSFLGSATRLSLDLYGAGLNALVDNSFGSVEIGAPIQIDWDDADMHLIEGA